MSATRQESCTVLRHIHNMHIKLTKTFKFKSLKMLKHKEALKVFYSFIYFLSSHVHRGFYSNLLPWKEGNSER